MCQVRSKPLAREGRCFKALAEDMTSPFHEYTWTTGHWHVSDRDCPWAGSENTLYGFHVCTDAGSMLSFVRVIRIAKQFLVWEAEARVPVSQGCWSGGTAIKTAVYDQLRLLRLYTGND